MGPDRAGAVGPGNPGEPRGAPGGRPAGMCHDWEAVPALGQAVPWLSPHRVSEAPWTVCNLPAILDKRRFWKVGSGLIRSLLWPGT